jgi:hypothetical protein
MDGPVAQSYGHGTTEMQYLHVPGAALLLEIIPDLDLGFRHRPSRIWSRFSIHHLVWRMYPSLEALELEGARALLECEAASHIR